MNYPVHTSRDAFRLNIGFLINQVIGTSRDFIIEYPSIHIEPDLDLDDLSANIRITRTPQGMFVQTKLSAISFGQCVRCLTEVKPRLEVKFSELYAFSTRTVSDSGLILPEDGHIDLAPIIRDYVWLEIPSNPLCSIECKGLCVTCGENLNTNPHKHEEETIDPRLARLQELL